MNKPTLKMLIISLLLVSAVGIYMVVEKSIPPGSSIFPQSKYSQDTLLLISEMKNEDVGWDGNYIGIMPTKLSGATLSLKSVQEDINPLLIDALTDKDKFVAAHVLLVLRTSKYSSISSSEWNGLKVQLNSSETTKIITFDGNDLKTLQKYWREDLEK